MKKNTVEYKMMMEQGRLKVSNPKLLTGSLVGKYPIKLDEGRTTIFISDLSKEAETRERYEHRGNKNAIRFVKKPKP
ncbi:MAG TPA: hypothetical protein VMC08_05135 [Bacteroidales bacterium]|nr:hypothetical protein [Bacteroidales bacterium]